MRRFFAWLESKSYKMHIRVLLSKYRAYTACETCGGARLKSDALLWRLGTEEDADGVLAPEKRFRPHGVELSDATVALAARIDGARPDAAADRSLPASSSRICILPAPLDEATDLLLTEIRSRLGLSQSGGAGLSHARPAIAHAFRRRGAADQPHYRAWAPRWSTRCSSWTSHPSVCIHAIWVE